MLVDTSEVSPGHRGSFTSAFSPRVLGIHYSTADSNLGGYSFEVRIANFDLLSGRFKESLVRVLLEGHQVREIAPELSEDALGVDRVGDIKIFAVADAHHGFRSSESIETWDSMFPARS